MKAAGFLVGGAILLLASQTAWAQQGAIDIVGRCGLSGQRIEIPDTAQSFTYEADIHASGTFTVRLEVFHNGILKYHNLSSVVWSGGPYYYSRCVDMSTWGLRPGDVVHFRATGWLTSQPNIIDVDELFCDVVASAQNQKTF